MSLTQDLSRLSSVGNLLKTPKPATSAQSSGEPINVSLDLIDPDPNQPRREFNEEALNELAASIRRRKVKQPVSIRTNKEKPGRYILNFGERRWRASHLAEQKSIPAFIDEDFTPDDQVIENLQRENFTTRELINIVNTRLRAGRKKVEIAQALGKSKAWVGQYATLADMPEPINAAFESGHCEDVTVLNELCKLYKVDAHEVEKQIKKAPEITRGVVDKLKKSLAAKLSHTDEEGEASAEETEKEAEEGEAKAAKPKLKTIKVTASGRVGVLDLKTPPQKVGFAKVLFADSPKPEEVALAALSITEMIF